MTFGSFIRNRRRQLGLTIQDVQDRTGISYQTLYRYERDKTFPITGNLAVLCRAYDLSYEDVKEAYPAPGRALPTRAHTKENELTKRLIDARVAKGLKQADVAGLLGKSYALVSAWESGRIIPSKEILERLADIYEVDYSELFEEWADQKKEMEKPYTVFAMKLRYARISARLTQADVMRMIGLSNNVLTRYENGREYPSDDILCLMADIYNDESLRPEERKVSYPGQTDFSEKLKELEKCYPVNLVLKAFPGASIKDINMDALEEAMSGLKGRDQGILLKRYKYGMSLESVGRDYGVTRERIRQIEARAIRALRRHGEIVESPLMAEVKRLRAENNRLRADFRYEDKPIEALGFSTRTYNCLKRSGVNTVEELSLISKSDLMCMRNMGMKSINEVEIKLDEMGCRLRAI